MSASTEMTTEEKKDAEEAAKHAAAVKAAGKKIAPTDSRLIIHQDEVKEKRKSGIVIATVGSGKDKPKIGTVLGVGPGKVLENGMREPMGYKEGARVIFSSYAGTDIKVDEIELKIMDRSDILATVEAEAEIET
jgi:chaperonin GroES